MNKTLITIIIILIVFYFLFKKAENKRIDRFENQKKYENIL